MQFLFAQNARAGAVIAHARNLSAAVLARAPTVHKFGVAVDPHVRWSNPLYGYARHPDFTDMLVLFRGDGAAAGMLEAALVAEHHGRPGCRNEATGGESVRSDAPVCFYMVYKHLLVPNMGRNC